MNIGQIASLVSIIAVVVGGVVYAENAYEKAGTAKQQVRDFEVRQYQREIDLLNTKKQFVPLEPYEQAQLEYYKDSRDNLLKKDE